jgi:hypothetical protein
MVTNNSRAALKEPNLPDAYGAEERLAHAPSDLRVAVPLLLQGVEDGAELSVASGLEVVQGV